MQLEWSKDAIKDLDNIWEYIAADNIMRAFSSIDELRLEARKLAENPMIGIRIPELNDNNFREWFYRDYTIILKSWVMHFLSTKYIIINVTSSVQSVEINIIN